MLKFLLLSEFGDNLSSVAALRCFPVPEGVFGIGEWNQ
jgi:hypothetical protein